MPHRDSPKFLKFRPLSLFQCPHRDRLTVRLFGPASLAHRTAENPHPDSVTDRADLADPLTVLIDQEHFGKVTASKLAAAEI